MKTSQEELVRNIIHTTDAEHHINNTQDAENHINNTKDAENHINDTKDAGNYINNSKDVDNHIDNSKDAEIYTKDVENVKASVFDDNQFLTMTKEQLMMDEEVSTSTSSGS